VTEHEIEGTEALSSAEAGSDDGLVADEQQLAGVQQIADTAVAGALAELDTLPDRDVAEHPEVFERIHQQLHSALSAIDDT
jgi:hypothetical protein